MAETTVKASTKPSTKRATRKTVPEADAPKVVATSVEPIAEKPKKSATAKTPRATGTRTKKTAAPSVLTDEQRYKMIAEAAYYRAESHQFQSDHVRDWIEAEKEIEARLAGKK